MTGYGLIDKTCAQCGAPYRGRTGQEPKRWPDWCKKCRQRARSLEQSRTDPNWQRRAMESQQRRRDAVAALKVEMGCIDCGYNTHPAALDFDHTNGKTANISELRSMKRVLEEIERHACVVRCANCHRIKTWERKHG